MGAVKFAPSFFYALILTQILLSYVMAEVYYSFYWVSPRKDSLFPGKLTIYGIG